MIGRTRKTSGVFAMVALVTAAGPASAGLVDVSTAVSATDSITVGERFDVKHVFTYPDSLAMSVPRAVDPGTCRILSLTWKDGGSDGVVEKTATLSMITLDLEAARLPEWAVEFYTPSGGTLIVFADEVVIPVRQMAAAGAEAKPLKEQWTAPGSYWKWIVAAALLLAAAALLWWWLGRRARRGEEAPAKPMLPADYVALTELTRIERMHLLEGGEFKTYYTLVTDAVRRYLEARFGIDAMERTTAELLDELSGGDRRVDKLDDLLNEADLVKFAKHVPGVEAGTTAMSSAREIVVKTTPKRITPEETETVAAGGNG